MSAISNILDDLNAYIRELAEELLADGVGPYDSEVIEESARVCGVNAQVLQDTMIKFCA